MQNLHHIVFCADDGALVDGLEFFISAALKKRNPAIVWATESHRNDLIRRLRADGLDIDAAIQRGTYIASDAGETADPERILRTLRGLREASCKAGTRQPRVAVCGERAGRLWAEGKKEAALQIEQLFNELAKRLEIDILCVYPLPHEEDRTTSFNTLCQEHSSFSCRWSGA